MRYIFFLLLSINLFSSTLNLAISSNPSRLNPLLATDSGSAEISGFIFNALVKYDKNLTTIVGDLATDFYFKDNKTLIFKLRKNVKWHDGKPFSSKDVVFTYQTIVSPKISSPYSSSFRFVSSVEALDEHTVVIKYKTPYFKALESWTMGIVPEHLLKNETNLMNSTFNTHPVGTGAYRLHKLEHFKNIELKAFENYFEGAPKIDKISFNIIADPTTRFLMLKSGQLDIDSLEPLQYEKQLPKEFFNKFNLYENISHSYSYLGFNLKDKKFQDPRVRKALSLAINREELIKILFFSHAKVCTGPFLPNTPAFNSAVNAPKQDIKTAKKLLKEAGYSEANPLIFEIATSNSNSIRPYAAQILQHQLKQAGIVVTLKIIEWQAFLNMVVTPRKFETILLGWGLSPTPDPYMLWHSDSDTAGGFNMIGYKNKALDEMINAQQSMVDEKRLAKTFKEMFAIITNDNPYLFLYIPTSLTVVNKNIKNIEASPSGIWHNYIKWEKE